MSNWETNVFARVPRGEPRDTEAEKRAVREPGPHIGPGSKVKFIAHGATGLPHTVVTRDGDDCCLCDPRGRMLPNVPFELLVLVPGPPPNPAFRAVDELQQLFDAGLVTRESILGPETRPGVTGATWVGDELTGAPIKAERVET